LLCSQKKRKITANDWTVSAALCSVRTCPGKSEIQNYCVSCWFPFIFHERNNCSSPSWLYLDYFHIGHLVCDHIEKMPCNWNCSEIKNPKWPPQGFFCMKTTHTCFIFVRNFAVLNVHVFLWPLWLLTDRTLCFSIVRPSVMLWEVPLCAHRFLKKGSLYAPLVMEQVLSWNDVPSTCTRTSEPQKIVEILFVIFLQHAKNILFSICHVCCGF
jgi:hypothetical protein